MFTAEECSLRRRDPRRRGSRRLRKPERRTAMPTLPDSEAVPTKRANVLERFSRVATEATGSSTAFGLALLVVVVWGATGPSSAFPTRGSSSSTRGRRSSRFSWSSSFSAVRTRIRARCTQAERARRGYERCDHRLINAEGLTEPSSRCCTSTTAARGAREGSSVPHQSHSIEEAAHRHALKHRK